MWWNMWVLCEATVSFFNEYSILNGFVGRYVGLILSYDELLYRIEHIEGLDGLLGGTCGLYGRIW